MDKTLQLQNQIRHNATEISTALSSMSKWEKEIGNRDGNIKKAHAKAMRVPRAPIRSGVGTVPIKVEKAVTTAPTHTNGEDTALWQTPSTIVAQDPAGTNAVTAGGEATHKDCVLPVQRMGTGVVPKARGEYHARDIEEAEREHGNAEFKMGNFTAAVKSYTKCLGMKSRNYVAFSNRAMCYLKLKEYERAVSDCSSAIAIESTHIKSLLRRSSAYNSLGKHRAALRDLKSAQELDPSSKQTRSELQHTRELLRSAANRAPMVAAAQLQRTTHTSSGNASSGSSANTKQLFSSSSGDRAGVHGEAQIENQNPQILQGEVLGPDPRPPGFTTIPEQHTINNNNINNENSVATTGTSTTYADAAVPESVDPSSASSHSSVLSSHRVAIEIEDDDGDSDKEVSEQEQHNDETNAQINKQDKQEKQKKGNGNDGNDGEEEEDAMYAALAADVETVTLHSEASLAANLSAEIGKQPKKISFAKNVQSPGSVTKKMKKNQRAESPGTGSTSTTTIRSSYDLQRELTRATTTTSEPKTSALGRVFKGTSLKQVKVLLKDCMEPTVLHLLLTSVHTYYGEKKHQWGKVYNWFEAVQALPCFALQYSLLEEEHRRHLKQLLGDIPNSLCANIAASAKGEEVEEEEKGEGGGKAKDLEICPDILISKFENLLSLF